MVNVRASLQSLSLRYRVFESQTEIHIYFTAWTAKFFYRQSCNHIFYIKPIEFFLIIPFRPFIVFDMKIV